MSIGDEENKKKTVWELILEVSPPFIVVLIFLVLMWRHNNYAFNDGLINLTILSLLMVFIGVYFVGIGRSKESTAHDLITVRFFIKFSYITLSLTSVLFLLLGAKYIGLIDFLLQ